MIISWVDWLTRMGGKGGIRDIWPIWSLPVKKSHKWNKCLNDRMILQSRENRLQNHWPCSTSVFTSSSSQESGTQIPTKYWSVPYIGKKHVSNFWSIRMTFHLLQLLFFGFYLPKEHLAVLSWEGGTVGRATLLQQARLVGITSFNIATHLSKCIIHWHTTHTSTTKQHTHTPKFNFVQRIKQRLTRQLGSK